MSKAGQNLFKSLRKKTSIANPSPPTSPKRKTTIFTITEDSPRGEETIMSTFGDEIFMDRTFFLPEDSRDPNEPDKV